MGHLSSLDPKANLTTHPALFTSDSITTCSDEGGVQHTGTPEVMLPGSIRQEGLHFLTLSTLLPGSPGVGLLFRFSRHDSLPYLLGKKLWGGLLLFKERWLTISFPDL